MFKLPKCRHCGRSWKPPESVCATQSFCEECSTDRREIARRQLELAPSAKRYIVGGYALPRSFRRRRTAIK